MLPLLVALCVLVPLIHLLLILSWLALKHSSVDCTHDDLPEVSVLVAARNEEENIERCLNALLQLNYPKHKLEILIGDDSSTDATYELVEDIAQRHQHIKLIKIIPANGHLKGKANVLSQLAAKATGDIFFITDADIAVNTEWVKRLLATVRHTGAGIVNGVTLVEDSSLQNIDWLFSIGMIKVITEYSRPVTAIGNNMCITREAYESVGGYEKLPFSITEDFELFKHVYNKGNSLVQLFDKQSLAFTVGQKGLSQLLHQRKRWMHGAVQLPWFVVLILSLQASFYGFIVLLLFLNPIAGSLIWGVKFILQSVFIFQLARHVKSRIDPLKLLLYEVYAMIISTLSGLFYLIPISIKWKGRKY